MLSGGKLFDEGMYGCIFTPQLECKDKPARSVLDESDTPVLSKLILKDAAEHEYSISKRIMQIPLWKNYFIASETICTPAQKQKEKDLDDCPVLKDHELSEFRILSMPYGGIPLNVYRINIKTFDFYDFVLHFIEAVALFNLFGIVHRDIHQGNILVDDNQVPRIIDFNLSVLVKGALTQKTFKHTYNVITAQEPPDSTLVNAVSLGHDGQRIIESIIHKKPIMKKIRNILGISAVAQQTSLERFYQESRSAKVGDNLKWFNSYWRTVDSWAAGVNIIDLISKLSLWPEFSIALKRVSPRLFPVLKKLCEVNPVRRIDCVQALNYLNPNSFIIRKYGKIWLNRVGDGNI